MTYAAEGILLFDLRRPDGGHLPAFTPGAHIDLHFGGALSRSYSLVNSSDERHRYLLGVKREPASRGGSSWLHDVARVGSLIDATAPKNNFALEEAAGHTVLVAGGIGITPLLCMLQRLRSLQRPWELHYCARSRSAAIDLEEITGPLADAPVHVRYDDEAQVPGIDIAEVVRNAPEHAHFYCCGPAPMIAAFQQACGGFDPARVHFEYFASEAAPATQGGFTVRLARSGMDVQVSAGQTILECLLQRGIDVPSSCQQGVCGACETRVLGGSPDHRDLVLSDGEKAVGETMMICCSGSRSESLVLDL